MLVRACRVEISVDIGDPFDQRPIESAPEPIGDPAVHMRHGLNQDVAQEASNFARVTHNKIDVARRDVDAADCESGASGEPPVDVSS